MKLRGMREGTHGIVCKNEYGKARETKEKKQAIFSTGSEIGEKSRNLPPNMDTHEAVCKTFGETSRKQ